VRKSAYFAGPYRWGRSLPGEKVSLSAERRLLALFVVAAGILTFFLPLITAEPTVLGNVRWSAWSIASQVMEGNLPYAASSAVNYIPIDSTLTYCVLLVALGVLCFVPSPRALAATGLIGGLSSCHALIWDFDKWHLERLFYGKTWASSEFVGHVDLHQLTIALLVVTIALFLVSFDAISGPEVVGH